jgi:hypothetical protein
MTVTKFQNKRQLANTADHCNPIHIHMTHKQQVLQARPYLQAIYIETLSFFSSIALLQATTLYSQQNGASEEPFTRRSKPGVDEQGQQRVAANRRHARRPPKHPGPRDPLRQPGEK